MRTLTALMLQCVAVRRSVLHCVLQSIMSLRASTSCALNARIDCSAVAVCCSVLQYVAVCCSVLQGVEVCGSARVAVACEFARVDLMRRERAH